MNNIIFQYLVVNENVDKRGDINGRKRSDLYLEMADISRRSFEIYAKEIGCEYLYSDERVFTKGHGCAASTLYECLRVIYDPYFDQFDKVLFADTDIVVNTKENIFDVSDAEVYGVLESDIKTERGGGGYNAWDFNKDTYQDYFEKFSQHDMPMIPSFGIGHSFDSKLTILNTGVVVWTKEARLKARELFSNWEEWCYPKAYGLKEHHMSICNDQPYISANLMKHNFDLESIPQMWNDTPPHYKDPNKWIEGKGDRKCYFLHYTGGDHKAIMVEQYHNNEFPIFREDWDKWET